MQMVYVRHFTDIFVKLAINRNFLSLFKIIKSPEPKISFIVFKTLKSSVLLQKAPVCAWLTFLNDFPFYIIENCVFDSFKDQMCLLNSVALFDFSFRNELVGSVAQPVRQFSPAMLFQSITIFISLEIDCFHSQ